MKNEITKFLERFFVWLEQRPVSWGGYLLTFFFAFHFRTFLELLFDGVRPVSGYQDVFFHFSLFYVCFFCALLILYHVILKVPVKQLARVILPSSVILVMVPFIDMYCLPWKDFTQSYFYPGQHTDMLFRFFTFGGKWEAYGVTPGIRLEVFLVMMVSYFYARYKGAGRARSCVLSFSFYVLCFLFCVTPFFIKFIVEALGFTYALSAEQMIQFFLLLFFILGMPLAYVTDKASFQRVLSRFDPSIYLHGCLFFTLGFLWHRQSPGADVMTAAALFFKGILSFISIFFVWIVLEVMSLSAKEKPFIDVENRYVLLGASLCATLYCLHVSFEMFYLSLVIVGNHYLQNYPPFFFRRSQLLRYLHFSFSSLILFICGYNFYWEDPLTDIYLAAFLMFALTVVAYVYESLSKPREERHPQGVKGASLWVAVLCVFFSVTFQNTFFSIYLIAVAILQYIVIQKKQQALSILKVFYFVALFGMILMV